MNRPFEINPEVYPFESRWMEVKGLRIHYIDEGPAEGADETIVCFHGNPSWSLLYAPLIGILMDRRRCIAVDLPGFGMSEKPTPDKYGYTPAEHAAVLEAFVDALGLDKFSVFVQDWGGPIGLTVAAQVHEKIQRVFLGNTWAWMIDGNTDYARATADFSAEMGTDENRAKNLEKNTIVKLVLPMLLRGVKKNKPGLRGAMKDAYLAPFLKPEHRYGPTWFPRNIVGAKDFFADLETNLPVLLEKPAILFWGEKDPIFPVSIRDDWEKRLKNKIVVNLPEASHFFQDEEPEKIAAAIIGK